MEKTRLPIPAGLAIMPPGPELAAVLADIDLSRLGGLDCVTVMQAQHRQASHEQARLMAAMVEVAVCGIGPDDALPRMDAPDEFSADEIRGALVWTRAAATAQLSLAWDLRCRLPQVFASLERGVIDVPKAKVFSDWTSGLTDDQARQVCEALLPAAPELTTGQLTEQIKKLAIAIDPDWARRRYVEAVRERKVVGYRNEDGSANLCGYQLPADRAAAACANLDALAKKIKRAGDGRPIDSVRADLYLAMLDGSYTGWAERDIIAHIITTSAEAGLDGPDHERRLNGPPAATSPEHKGRVDDAADMGGGIDRAAEHGTRTARRAGVEIRVELTTLLGLDDHPGELPGSGPVHADVARRLIHDQTAAEWRYALTDDDGHLRYEGITRRRPAGYPSRSASPCRGGIVELQVRVAVLRQLAARPVRLGGWANVIADLIRQADQHERSERADQGEPSDQRERANQPDQVSQSEQADRSEQFDYRRAEQCEHLDQDEQRERCVRAGQGMHADLCGQVDHRRAEHWEQLDQQRERCERTDEQGQVGQDGRAGAGRYGQRHGGGWRDRTAAQERKPDEERGPRTPGRPLRRRTEIRDRTCTHPRCRAPAHGTDGDHIQEWARGGATHETNIGSACRHDHRLKHEGGWRVIQPVSGQLVWISRLGIHYRVASPLIIQPFPDPVPREGVPSRQPEDREENPMWREPAGSPTKPGRSPPQPPDPSEPVPF